MVWSVFGLLWWCSQGVPKVLVEAACFLQFWLLHLCREIFLWLAGFFLEDVEPVVGGKVWGRGCLQGGSNATFICYWFGYLTR